jgi:hypothetical protein
MTSGLVESPPGIAASTGRGQCGGVRALAVIIGPSFKLLCNERRTVREQNMTGCQFAKESDAVGVEKRDVGKIEDKRVSAVPAIDWCLGADAAQLFNPGAGDLAL